MMKLYRYLYYRLYSWNLKTWGEKDLPQWNALFGVSFMMFSNLCLAGLLLQALGFNIFLRNELPKLEIGINGLIPMEPKLKLPQGVENKTGKEGFFPNGNFTITDNFTAEKLDFSWIGVRGPREKFISITKKGLQIAPFDVNIREVKPTSTLFRRLQHSKFTSTVTLEYLPKTEKDLAGVVCYQKESFNYVFGVTKKGKEYYIVLERNEGRKPSVVLASAKIDVSKPIQLQVNGDGDNIQFNYSINKAEFVNLGGTLSSDILTTNVAGGFTGSFIGLYATIKNDIVPQ